MKFKYEKKYTLKNSFIKIYITKIIAGNSAKYIFLI